MPPLHSLNTCRDKIGGLKKTALTLAIAQAVTMSSAQAATIFVDVFDDNMSPFTGEGCNLRQAILSANTNQTPALSSCIAGDSNTQDIIRFNNTAAQTIILDNDNDTIEIGDDLQILGPVHAPVTIDGSADSNTTTTAFSILNDSNVTLNRLSIRNASVGIRVGNGATATIQNSSVSDNRTQGIIAYANSTLIVERSTISSNGRSNFSGDRIFRFTGRDGAGISTDGDLFISHSTISGNSGLKGGGIFIDGTGTLDLRNSTVGFNYSVQRGGGLHLEGQATVFNSIISHNTAFAFSRVLDGEIRRFTRRSHEIYNSEGNQLSLVINVIGNSSETFERAVNQFTPPGALNYIASSDERNEAILSPTLANNGGRTLTHATISSLVLNRIFSRDICNQPDQANQRRANDVVCDLGAIQPLALESTIVVNSLSDAPDSSTCSLRDAIMTVNRNFPFSGCGLGGAVNDTIEFDDDLEVGSILLTSPLPLIDRNVVINGSGQTIDAGEFGRVFDIDDGAVVEINNLTSVSYTHLTLPTIYSV